MFFLTPPGMFIVLVLLIIRRLLRRWAYERPDAVSLNTLSQLVDRVVLVVFWWVIIAMIIEYNDWQIMRPSTEPVNSWGRP